MTKASAELNDQEGRPKVLVIDDSPLDRELVERALGRKGYAVATLDTPIAAAIRVAEEQPQLVLVDLNMASLSGEYVVKSLKSSLHLRRIPVVLYSSESESTMRAAAERSGADGFVQKRGAQGLIEAVAQWVRPPTVEG